MSNLNNTIEYICEQARDPKKFVQECEKRYNNIIANIAQQIAESGRTEIVMVAGPSSSGKTTSAKKLREALAAIGVESYTISLDDFYVDNDKAPRFPDGTPDFETVNALDIPYFEKTMTSLLENGEGELPTFDFVQGKRSPDATHLKITPTDVIIVEGLHALNPIITGNLPAERLLRIYINVSSRIYDKDGNIVFNKRNMRFLRRVVRDYNFRGNDVEKTFKLWVSVRYGEDAYLYPYKDNADIRINTIHLYETCVLKDTALMLLKEVTKDSAFYSESQRLIRSLQRFPSLPASLIPENSLLREFVKE